MNVKCVMMTKLCGCRNRRFIIVWTRDCHVSVSRTRWMHCTPSQPVSLRSVLLPTSFTCCSSEWFLSFGLSHACHMPSLPHSFDLICIRILGCEYNLMKFPIFHLSPPHTKSLLGPNILSTLLSDTLNLCSSVCWLKVPSIFRPGLYPCYHRQDPWKYTRVQNIVWVSPAKANLMWANVT
jgi:hypothetical protein